MKEGSYFLVNTVLSDLDHAEQIAESLRGLDGVKYVTLNTQCQTILVMPDMDYTSSHYVGLICVLQHDDSILNYILSTIREVGKSSVMQLQYYPVTRGRKSGKTTAMKAVIQCITQTKHTGMTTRLKDAIPSP